MAEKKPFAGVKVYVSDGKKVEYMIELWREYPDAPSTESTYFALSQAIYAKASEVEGVWLYLSS